MKLKNIQKLLLLAAITILLVGLASAATTNKTSTTKNTQTIEKTIKSQHHTIKEQKKQIINKHTLTNKNAKRESEKNKIVKKDEKNLKSENTPSQDINDYDELKNAIYDNPGSNVVTVNIKNNITLGGSLELNPEITLLTINGNNNKISGNQEHQFLTIASGKTVTINKLLITNCNGTSGGSIDNNGTLKISDSTLSNSKAEENGGAILNRNDATLTITNCTLNNNTASYRYGGAIYNYGSLKITDSKLFDNKADDDAGALYNAGNLTLTKSSLYNNTATESGGAIFNDGDFNITNTTFNNNIARYGGVIDNYRNMIIKNTTFNNNEARNDYSSSGAVLNNGKLTITTSKFNNNKVLGKYGNGGAIDNTGKMNISNCTFNNNKATESDGNGGAISNRFWSTLTIYNCTLENNEAINGGALYNEHSTFTIDNNIFRNNVATELGGAIRNYAGDDSIIINNDFINNSANKGSAINSEGYMDRYEYENIVTETYYGKNLSIKNNKFVKNKAKTSGKAIINEGSNTLIENNRGDDISLDSSTIYIKNVTNTTITMNTFDDGRKNTTITISLNNSKPYVDDNIEITFTLKDQNNKAIPNGKITATINEKNYNLTTNANGIVKYNYKAATSGTQSITAKYNGNTSYFACTTNLKVSINKINTTLTLKLNATKLYKASKVKVTITLKDINANKLKNQKITVKIGSNTYTLTTDNNAIATKTYKTTKTGTIKVTANYAGSTKYYNSITTTKMKVLPKIKSKLTIKLSKSKVKVKDKIKVKVTLKNGKSKAIKSQKVAIKIGSKTYNKKTNSKGIITFNYKVVKSAIGKAIKATYKGNYMYLSSKASKKLLKA